MSENGQSSVSVFPEVFLKKVIENLLMASVVFGLRAIPAKLQPERLVELETGGGQGEGKWSRNRFPTLPLWTPNHITARRPATKEVTWNAHVSGFTFLWPSLFRMDFSVLSIYFSNASKPAHLGVFFQGREKITKSWFLRW